MLSSRARRSVYIFLTVILLTLVGIVVGPLPALVILIIAALVFLPLGLAWRFAPMPKNERRLTWNQSTAIIVATLILGNGLVVAWPLWLAPPRLSYTPLVYLIPAVAWFPVTLICLLLRPTGRGSFSSVVFLVIFGIALCIFTSAIAGPNVGILSFTPQECQQENAATGQSRYTCKHTSAFGVASSTSQVVFEGPTVLPFVRLVSWHHEYNP